MKPYYDHEGITIYHGDCREILPELPKVDLVITSPPYNVGLNYGVAYQDTQKDGDFRLFMEDWLTKAFEISADPSRMYIAVGEEMLWWSRSLIEEIGWKYGQMLVWCKPNICSPRKILGDWDYMTDWILLFRKGKRTPMLNDEGSRTFNWFIHAYPQSNFKREVKIHPAQWPVKLIRAISSRTPSALTIDPFMGSGVVLRVARDLGRQAIGIDISEENCEMVAKSLSLGPAKRMSQTVMAL